MGSYTKEPLGDFYTEALVVGGGFGGMYALHSLRRHGFSTKLVEAAGDFGGVWYWNRYPDARVDSEFPFYQLSVPEAYKSFDFNQRFPDHVELRRYFNHVAEVLDLRKDAIFNTIVQGVTWNDDQWTCRTKDGRTITCKYLLLCTGSSYKKNFPAFPGLDKFSGRLIHSAAYPENGVDVRGKKVAVIGNGSSGIQIIQSLAKEDCSLTAYIRTPILAIPMEQRPITAQEQKGLKSFYNVLLNAGKACKPGFPYDPPKPFSETTEDEREAYFEDLWGRGGFSYFLSNYRELVTDKEVNACVYNFWARKTRARIHDAKKRDIVAPLKQEHWFAMKRPGLETDYYEAIDRPNVEIISLKNDPIQSFTEDGIVTDELRKHDIIILATGYDSLTGSLIDLQIQDRQGRTLEEKWKEGVQTYLGLMVPGMPNMFMVYSPQAPTALTNAPPLIEMQVDWIIEVLQRMKKEDIKSIEPQQKFASEWRQAIQDMNEKTLYPLENSWYMGANIPGKVREQLNYIGGVSTYNEEIWKALDGWQGFDLVKK